MSGPVVIDSTALRVTINPQVGGTITRIEHVPLGFSVLGTVPWDPVTTPDGSFGAPDERRWLTRYTGGWPLLFPNGGDACQFEGAFHGFHGEASIAPWKAEHEGAAAIRLTRRFFTVPVEMERHLSLDGDLLTVRETVRMVGSRPVSVMWGHHPTFGSDLLAAPFEITTGARRVRVDEGYDPPSNPLVPGAEGRRLSEVPGKAGPFDLGRPAGTFAAMAYLLDFETPWVSLRRLDDAIAMALSWDAAVFPCAWLWFELGGTPEPPWHGLARLIGIEPNATWPATGLADSVRRGSNLIVLEPGSETTATVRLHVFKPSGPVADVGTDGRARI